MSAGALCLLAAFIVLAIAGSALAYVLVVSGRTRAATEDEVTDRLMRWDPDDYASYAKMPGATGVRREASVSIDDLQRLAKQGKWLQFWCWPVAISGLFGGIQLIGTAALFFAGGDDKVSWVTLLGTPISLLPFYVAWQALYAADSGADIDAN